MLNVTQLEGFFKGLADANRLRILNLMSHGELCGCDIQYVLGMTQPNVSRHLIYLKHAGLVADRREGFRVFYRLADATNGELGGLFGFLQAAFKADGVFQSDLARLEEAVKEGACQVRQTGALSPSMARVPASLRHAGQNSHPEGMTQIAPALR